ncbi:MAG: hypothetical protein FWD71_00020 [Oscillospiraceae bacterium]|nr:hypothetical protein [Oscillospiraceae bacterium]
MASLSSEKKRVRELAKAYAEYAASPLMESRRKAWSEHNALNFTRPLIYIRAIPFDEFFDTGALVCTERFLRGLEYWFLKAQYHAKICDDFIEEPYMTARASVKTSAGGVWGLPAELTARPVDGGAAAYAPSLTAEADIEKLQVIPHEIDEPATQTAYEQMADVLDGIMDVYIDRQGALCSMWENDISTSLAKIRGLEQIMWDACDRPDWLHKLLSHMRDKILKNMDETEAAGDFSYVCHQNQAMPYMRGLNRPGGGRAAQSQLWGYMAAQEFTTFGPGMFDEFMFSYQKPILERYAVTSYGCCEDLTHKIGVLKKLRNLRRIGVSPFADLRSCAEQIGGEYVLSWRPNPSDMVSRGVDENYVRRYIRGGIDLMKQNGCVYDITLKDVETVSGDASAIINWTRIVRDEINRAY